MVRPWVEDLKPASNWLRHRVTGSVIEATTWKGEEGEGVGVLNMKKMSLWPGMWKQGWVMLEGVE